MVDEAGQKLLHMNSTVDPARSPTFTFFGNPNFFFEAFGTLRPTVFTGDSWNHGDIQPEIGRTFIGMVGPGVNNLGITQPQDFFTDHVDVRPTLMTLTVLSDDYSHDGRTIVEMLNPCVLPVSLGSHRETALLLGQALKQIDAPFGSIGNGDAQGFDSRHNQQLAERFHLQHGGRCDRILERATRLHRETNQKPTRRSGVRRASDQRRRRSPADPSCTTPPSRSAQVFSNAL
jgi:hypothetical protein